MTKLQAVITQKCPRCREGDLFKTSAFSLRYSEMYPNCSNCGQKYEIEPGFFYAAMYVSYVLVIAQLVTSGFLAFYIFGEDNVYLIIAATITPTLLLFTLNFRYSRTLLLHYLSPIKYRK